MANVYVFKNSPRIVISNNTHKTIVSEKVRAVLDTNRMIFGETPTPSVNGVVTVFTTANAYVSGTLEVTRGTLRMHPTADFTETSSTTFTMVSAPESNEPLIVDYIKS